MALLVVGSVAFDPIHTPSSRDEETLGASALSHALLTEAKKIPRTVKRKLALLVGKYLSKA